MYYAPPPNRLVGGRLAVTPDVYLEIPLSYKNHVRNSPQSFNLVSFGDSNVSFNTPVVFNGAISGSNAPYTNTEVNTLLNAKPATCTGGATTIATSDLTASSSVISHASGKVVVSMVIDTELS